MAAFTNNSQSNTDYSPTGHDNSVSKPVNDRDFGLGDNKRDNDQVGPVKSFDAYSTQNSGFASKPHQNDGQLGGIGSYQTSNLGGNPNNPFESVGLDGQAKEGFGQRAVESDKGSKESYGQSTGGFDAGSKEMYGQGVGGIDAASKDVYGRRAGGVDSGLPETRGQKSDRIDDVLGARGIGATLLGDSPGADNASRGQRMGEIDPGSAEIHGNRSDGIDSNPYTRVAGTTAAGDSAIDGKNKTESSKGYQPSQLGVASTGSRNDAVSGGAAFGLSDQVNRTDDYKSPNPERKGAESKNTPTRDTVSHDDHSVTNQKAGVSFDSTSRHDARNEADGPSPPSFGDKIKGKLEVTAGKISGNDTMIERGRDRQTADSKTSA